MKNRSTDNGTKVNDWATPQYIYDYIEKEIFKGKPYFDPCPLHCEFDGLSINWEKRNYINPPYTRKLKEAFIMKAIEESKKGKLCVMLLPVSTDTKIFHNAIVKYGQVRLLKGRVKFKGINTKGEYVTDKTGQSGSMIVIFGKGFRKRTFTTDISEASN